MVLWGLYGWVSFLEACFWMGYVWDIFGIRLGYIWDTFGIRYGRNTNWRDTTDIALHEFPYSRIGMYGWIRMDTDGLTDTLRRYYPNSLFRALSSLFMTFTKCQKDTS
ncbi:hypothetical protein P154DRAFT_525426 [Amniculicola lignicola CBS 123094]|uniref:Uncharacterized protein n=1 Tax=Amniculicola lignicola CBS 123094 TaxID=1392246 RepID=A0A6A5W5Z4_9PLEO|nr:hypothetical protein P154DRAFT_525426 [Amniculicola lignicola CBS 123094]